MTSTTTARGATAGMAGGVGWVLFPWGTQFIGIEHDASAAGEMFAIAYYGLLLVVPALLLLVGLQALHAHHRGRYGRLGSAGALVTGIGLGAMFTGLAVEMTTFTIAGEKSAIGHAIWMSGFLLLLPGSVLLGAAVWRAGVLARARLVGLLLVLVIPISVAVAALGGMAFPEGDTGFWLGLTLPYGLIWIVLATALRGARFAAPAPRAAAVAG
jgi:hypothetical protein